MKPTLCSLPEEIIEIIAGGLRPTNVCCLRRVSKKLNIKTFSHFSRHCFGTFHTDLSVNSLNDLEYLSTQEHLKLHLHSLVIRLSRDKEDRNPTFLNTFGQGFEWNRHSAGYLTAPLPGLQVLVQLLVDRLLNCRSFGIKAFEPTQPFPRDLSSERDISNVLNASDALNLVFTMIAERHLHVEHLGINLIFDEHLEWNRINAQQFTTHKFSKHWAKLSSLTIDTPNWRFGGRGSSMGHLLDLIPSAVNLRKLVFRGGCARGNKLLDRLCLMDSLPEIQELKFNTLTVSGRRLMRFMSRLRHSLKTVTLDTIFLTSRPWASMLSVMANDLPLLQNLLIKNANYHNPDTHKKSCTVFPALCFNLADLQADQGLIQAKVRSWSGHRNISHIRYTGPRMKWFLEHLAESTAEFYTPELPIDPPPHLPVALPPARRQRYRAMYSFPPYSGYSPGFQALEVGVGTIVDIVYKEVYRR